MSDIIIAADYKIHPNIWGGMDDFFREITEKLSANGIRSTIVLPQLQGSDPTRYQDLKIPYTLLGGPFFFDSLVDYCRRNPCKLLHTHFLPTLTHKYRQLGATAKTVMTTEHMSRPLSGWSLGKKFRSKLSAYVGAGHVSALVHVSKYLEQENKRFFGAALKDKSQVIYNGVRIKPFERDFLQRRQERRRLKLVSAGRLVHEKGFGELIEAIGRLLQQYGDVVELDILGDGPLRRQLVAMAGEHLNRNIFFRGYVNDVAQRFRNSDLYVHCASQEAFAFVLLEAGEAGLPVVAYDVGGNREVIEDGFNGYLLPPHDIDGLVAQMAFFVENEESIETYGKNARSLIAGEFSLDKMADNYLSLYQAYLA